MALTLYRKPDPTRTRPSVALYIAFFLLSFITINTYYLVFFEVYYRYYLWTFLAIGYFVSIYAHFRYKAYLDIAVNLLALVFFAVFFRQMINQPSSFGTILGQLLAVLLVLRSYILFNRDDFFVPLVVSLTIMLLCSIPSYESNFVISLQVYFFIIIVCLYFLSKSREVDESRLGYFELESIKKAFNIKRELRMLVLFGLIALLIATAIYLVIPHHQGTIRHYASPLRSIFGDRDRNRYAQPEEEEAALADATRNQKTETYVGFDEEKFKITSGRTIREGENANDIVMIVQMNYPKYMRAMTWDIYTNGEWKRSGELEKEWEILMKGNPNTPEEFRNPEFELTQARVITVKELEQNQVEHTGRVSFDQGYVPSSFLFLPWETTSIRTGINDIWTNDSGEVRTKMELRKRIRQSPQSYFFTTHSYFPAGMEATYLREHSGGTFLERYTQLPDSVDQKIGDTTLREFTRQLIKDANAATDYEKTKAIFNHLKSTGKYSLDIPACPPQYDLISYFVLEVTPRRGHCELFSSAMAVMLRCVDVPCRVVTGYSPGTYAFNRNSYIIREKNAHSWVEVFFPEIGWLEFDPTPNTLWNDTKDKASAIVAVVSNIINELYVYSPEQFYRNRIKPLVNRTVSMYNYRSGQFMNSLGGYVNVQIVYNAIMVIVILAGVLAIFLIFRKPSAPLETHRRVSRVYYSHVIESLRKKGNTVSQGQTPSEVQSFVAEKYPEAEKDFSTFIKNFHRINFARSDEIRDAVRSIKTSYRKALDSLRRTD